MNRTLLETVRDFLNESPEMVYVSKNSPYLQMKKHEVDADQHANVTPLFKTDSYKITRVQKDPDTEQYAKIDSNGNPIFRIHVGKTKLQHIPKRTGAYVGSLLKFNSANQYSDIKKVYDHIIDHNDYVRTDDIHYPGGRNTWLALVKDFEQDGKHLYIHKTEGIEKTTAQSIHDNQNMIWSSDKNHIVVSNNPL